MLEPRALAWLIKGEARVGGKLCFGLARRVGIMGRVRRVGRGPWRVCCQATRLRACVCFARRQEPYSV
jgi:hypothetical protein